MRLILLDLERTMDHLIAAQVCNATHSRLGRLPDEILLQILSYCKSDDMVHLYSLWRVSRTLRGLIYEPGFWGK